MIQTVGSTTHYTIKYDDAYSSGQTLANNLFQHCEEDFKIMQGWFQGVPFPATRITVTITPTSTPNYSGSATWNGGSNGFFVTIIVSDNVLSTTMGTIRWLLAGEVAEMFMSVQKKGWFGGKFVTNGNEGTVGEGLSLFLSQQLAIMKGFQVSTPNSFPANNWMTSSRLNLNQTLSYTDPHGPSNNPFEYAGLSLLFLYYLKDQLGFPINQIITNGPSNTGNLTEVYRNLTHDANDPFPAFKQLIEKYYPGKTPIPTNMYSPFPLPPSPPSPPSGWVQQNGKWFFYVNGIAQKGWIVDKSDGNSYQLDNTGAWTGWFFSKGNYYFKTKNGFGSLATGWNKINGQWWYFYSNGIMARNTTIGTYKLGPSGACLNC
nr:hypothetical protein [Bacillus cereus]